MVSSITDHTAEDGALQRFSSESYFDKSASHVISLVTFILQSLLP